MTVQAGETPAASPPSTTPTALVDAATLAREMVAAVAQLNQSAVQAPPQPAARVSALKAKADELLKSERIDKDVMPVMLELVQAMEHDLSEKAKEEMLRRGAEEQNKQIHSELGRMVERFGATSKNPELIRELKVAISQNAINEYNGNPALVNRYRTTGQVDWSELEKSVVKQVNKWGGTAAANEEKQAGGPAMKNEAPAGTVETRAELSRDMLDERQQEIFNAQRDFGKKQMGLDEAKAEKRALDLISKAESKRKGR